MGQKIPRLNFLMTGITGGEMVWVHLVEISTDFYLVVMNNSVNVLSPFIHQSLMPVLELLGTTNAIEAVVVEEDCYESRICQ
jgi:hypothetical protein